MKSFKSKGLGSMTLLAILFLLAGCSSDEDNQKDLPPAATSGEGPVKLEFKHIWGPQMTPFALENYYTQSTTGDSISFYVLQYYVSNIRFHKSDGSTWAEEESYHIIDAENSNVDEGTEVSLIIDNVPAGEYTGITYIIGVDSLRNVRGVQDGALDPANGLFWSWSTGYIFIRAEGDTPYANANFFVYHLGGFSQPYNAIMENYHTFEGALLRVSDEASPRLNLVVDVDHFWDGGIRITDMTAVHNPSSNSVELARNFANGIRFDHLHN